MPVQQGAMVGAGAFVVGLVLTFIIGQAEINATIGLFVKSSVLDGTLTGFTLLHAWPEFVGGGAMAGGLLVWAIVPLIVLVASGFVVANQGRRGNGPMDGVSVTVGYFVLTLVVFAYLIFLGGGITQINLDTIIAIVFTGIVFPVVGGAIGGVLAAAA